MRNENFPKWVRVIAHILMKIKKIWLEQDIRQVRKRFQQYAYQLKINHTIEDMSIPVVRRVDKPETIYPPYQPDIGNVYAGRTSRWLIHSAILTWKIAVFAKKKR